MIQLRHQQPSLWEGLFAEEVAELWEPWMRVVDELLEDEALVDAVYEAQGERHERSRSLGRPQTPAEVALRMLILKHVRNWSYETIHPIPFFKVGRALRFSRTKIVAWLEEQQNAAPVLPPVKGKVKKAKISN